jgi:hypothetical protein
MRSLWLASTALLITTGIACAQSAQTASPAPTGAISAAPTTPSGGSPGNMAPAAPSGAMAAPAMPAGASASPAPNGAASAPDVTAAAPDASPGKMAPTAPAMPAPSAASSAPMASGSKPMHHHHWSATAPLPQDASAKAYLHIAKAAIKHHDAALADDALSHAETRLLDRSVPQGQIAADDSAPIQSIESARQAVKAGDYSKASADIKQASSAVSGM